MSEATADAAPWPLDPATVYLNHGSFGSCPKPVLAAQSAIRERMEREPMRFLLRDLEGLLDGARERIARLAGAQAEDIALVTNATYAANAVFASIDWRTGDEIVVTDHGYPAVNNAAQRWGERGGARVVVATVPFPIAGPAEVTRAITAALSARTRLVVIDAITSPTALILPVAEIVSHCRSVGVDVFVDGAHAPGMLALDLDRLGAAYFTGNLHKWVCAPKGAGFLHVRRDRRGAVRPLATSHGATTRRTDRSKFLVEFDWVGTDDPSAILCVPAALEFLDGLHPRGLFGVMADNRALALAARALLCERLGLDAPCPDEMVGSMASVILPPGPAASSVFDMPLVKDLAARHAIEVPVFPWPDPTSRVLRVSAQRYNHLAQYEQLAAALAKELK